MRIIPCKSALLIVTASLALDLLLPAIAGPASAGQLSDFERDATTRNQRGSSYHPSEFFGMEFRPVWSSLKENTIQDFDAAVLVGWRYASLKAGYRWMHSPHQSLDGPELGLSLRW